MELSRLDMISYGPPWSFMTILKSAKRLIWGELDVPLMGLANDMQGVALEAPAAFSLVMDARYLWFMAHHRQPAVVHPKARPGVFQAELWQYDVAELFLADPKSGRYLELNLAPNGAWWSCEFTAPRVRAEEVDVAMPEVATFAEMSPDGSWLAAMAIPLDLLQARVGFGEGTRANVTMMLESPRQRFVSAVDLGVGVPDFHQPACFTELRFLELPSLS